MGVSVQNGVIHQKQNVKYAPEPEIENSYIYNKYFKDNKQQQKMEIRRPKTIEEYRSMLRDDHIQRQRIKRIKSTKLLIPSMNVCVSDPNAKKQLNKLINVIKITDLSELPYVDRELALIKVSSKQNRAEIIEIADLFRSRIIDVAEDSLVVEVTGDSEKINAVIQLISPFGIKEVARTGSVALLRGKKFN
jgi:hypothetical protein